MNGVLTDCYFDCLTDVMCCGITPVTERAVDVFQDHDGDGRPAAAGLPLHRPQPHREGSDPLNGAPRPEFRRCVQIVQH